MDRGDTGQRMVNMELSGMKKGRRQQRSFKDVVKEDVQRFGVTEEDSRDRGQRKKVKNSQTCRAFLHVKTRAQTPTGTISCQ